MARPVDPHLTIDQAADALGTGPDFITQLIAVGQLDHTGHSDDLRIPESALIAYAITAGDSSEGAGSHTPPGLSATAQLTDSYAFDGQGVAA
jgi:hypothetical protein